MRREAADHPPRPAPAQLPHAPLCLPLPAGGRKAEEGRRGTEGAHGEHPAQEGAGPAGPLSP